MKTPAKKVKSKPLFQHKLGGTYVKFFERENGADEPVLQFTVVEQVARAGTIDVRAEVLKTAKGGYVLYDLKDGREELHIFPELAPLLKYLLLSLPYHLDLFKALGGDLKSEVPEV